MQQPIAHRLEARQVEVGPQRLAPSTDELAVQLVAAVKLVDRKRRGQRPVALLFLVAALTVLLIGPLVVRVGPQRKEEGKEKEKQAKSAAYTPWREERGPAQLALAEQRE